MPPKNTLRLKEATGWFAAGAAFEKALTLLSDGAFKLFVYICMNAERRTGRLVFRQAELARALGKSRRSIGVYLHELQARGICGVASPANQHAAGVLEISEEYWPYVTEPITGPVESHSSREGDEKSRFRERERVDSQKVSREWSTRHDLHVPRHSDTPKNPGAAQSSRETAYVEAIGKMFLSRPCVRFRYSSADRQLARQWFEQGLELASVEQTILLGCGRKYVSWLNGLDGEPIASLHYFTSILDEISKVDLSSEYQLFNRSQVDRLEKKWLASGAASLEKPLADGACVKVAQPKR